MRPPSPSANVRGVVHRQIVADIARRTEIPAQVRRYSIRACALGLSTGVLLTGLRKLCLAVQKHLGSLLTRAGRHSSLHAADSFVVRSPCWQPPGLPRADPDNPIFQECAASAVFLRPVRPQVAPAKCPARAAALARSGLIFLSRIHLQLRANLFP
jgi:hypothetical protein